MKMFVDVPEVYLYRNVVDFRKSINGLVMIVEQQMQVSPLTGSVFVFCNKGRDKLKVLYWDKTGFALWYKRLEKDKFKWPNKLTSTSLDLSEQQLHWLFNGFDVLGHQAIRYDTVAL
ncbi:IS66 family insertion sequence element accessory protein TnpB [Colwellia sp. PAMC 21821]|uniref:IS66 family insertion sequence element accessory protein TnpB n=1 Tax=Colwellia sp. PAMC 21821 TaxID=1816219 RepID=UPI0009BF93F2|nr:IS66 family insertion sequence element accessory protein TnpB [Colwellia sp. PAMC 21821]ARD42982.1 transposase [Colwellia sp. PAMC 21821]ARD45545.1 transposase [Colwellia sp. PAMC 21821]ARD45643.1 transposase [Colwellia sp. PAMC 21821]ARD45753.1 transposase [Colwellia sp. PAMC 21821]ARD46241.1 transposase [Colwellia sp. PAMC 21821]